MSGSLEDVAVFATVSKHAIGGIVVIVIGVLAVLFGLVKTAIRTATLFFGAIVVIVGILLATRTI